MATMGRDVYLLRFMLSHRSNSSLRSKRIKGRGWGRRKRIPLSPTPPFFFSPNSEEQIFNFPGLSLSRRSNSEELTRLTTAADTVFQNRPFLCNRMPQKMCCSLKHTRLIAICFLTLCALRDCRHVTRRN